MNERVGVSRVNAGDAAMIDGDERSDILEFWTRSEEPLFDHAITNEKYIYIYFISDYENKLRIDKWVKLNYEEDDPCGIVYETLGELSLNSSSLNRESGG